MNEFPPPDDDDERQRRTNLIVLLGAIAGVILIVFLLAKLKERMDLQDCIAASHHDCEPVDMPDQR